jgi:signal transduction histidine kinase
MGIHYSDQEALDSAYYSFSMAEKVYEKIGDYYRKARMQYNSAYILRRSKNYVLSEVKALKSAKEFEHLNKETNLYRTYNHLGLLYNDLEKYDLAIEYHNKAKRLIPFLSNSDLVQARTLNNLSLVYQKQGKYEEAIEALDEALKNENLEQENRNLYAKLIDNRAYNRFMKGEEAVLDDFQRTLAIRRELENPAGQVISHLHLASFFLRAKDTGVALNHSRQALKLSEDYGFNRDILASLELLSKTDPINASVYMNQYTNLNDSLLLEERKIRDKFARIQFETEAYIAENKALERKNIWIILMSSLSLSSILFFFLLQRQRLKNKTLILENEQQEANEQIYNLMSKQQNRMEEGRVQERVRISQELHDGVLARLFGIRIGLGFLKLTGDEKSRHKYTRYLKEMQNAEQEIRALSHALKNDEVSSKKDFPLLLNDLLKEQSLLGRFNHKFTQKPDIPWDRIPDIVKINLYRIAQEALHNVIKYAHCNNVEIQIRKEEGLILMEIIDDGAGFVTKSVKGGIGLTNMRSRSKQIGASFEISSDPGQGTAIRISIPTKLIYDER